MGTTDAMRTQAEADRVARDATRELLAEYRDRGVALLDREIPGWWLADRRGVPAVGNMATEPIDLDQLDLSDAGWCVCGQLENPGMHDAYWNMVERLFGPHTPARFVAEVEHGFATIGSQYGILTDLWREVIEKRRANA